LTITFITGGIRSGKSEYAERLANEKTNVLYVGFGVITDDEMQERIETHQKRRPDHWELLTDPTELPIIGSTNEESKAILIDCLSTWLANRCMTIPEEELKAKKYQETILLELSNWLEGIKQLSQHVIIVSSEVGLGGVALYRLGRFYQDVLGKMNQLTAEVADEAFAVMSGLPLRLK
jgi:adenosylcobinamide kinase / adenosylcobinamide-phosphate guanylyltransferase